MPEAKMRNGKALKVLPDGAKRRMPDFKNAWNKMSEEQRIAAAEFIIQSPDAPELNLATAKILRDAKALVAREES